MQARLNESLDTASKTGDEASQALGAVQQECGKLRDDLQRAKDQIAALGTAQELAEADGNALREAKAALEAIIADLRAQIEGLKKQLSDSQGELGTVCLVLLMQACILNLVIHVYLFTGCQRVAPLLENHDRLVWAGTEILEKLRF